MIDRSEVNRALAKAIAYKQCGKDAQAEAWAAELVRLLGHPRPQQDHRRPERSRRSNPRATRHR
jgi:hypothetical protein